MQFRFSPWSVSCSSQDLPHSSPSSCSSPNCHGITLQRASALVEWHCLADDLSVTCLISPSVHPNSTKLLQLWDSCTKKILQQKWDLKLVFPHEHTYFKGGRKSPLWRSFTSSVFFGCHLKPTRGNLVGVLKEIKFFKWRISPQCLSYFQGNYATGILCAGRKVCFKTVTRICNLTVLKLLWTVSSWRHPCANKSLFSSVLKWAVSAMFSQPALTDLLKSRDSFSINV